MPSRLSKRTVDALAASPLPIIGYDAELKGFGVRIGARGSLSWFIEYRPGAGGRRIAKKRFYFGSREFTPEQARQTAKGLLANVALGGDPMRDRHRERQSLTFSEFAERYLCEEAEAKLKPGTIANYRIAIRKHANPELGRIKLDKISNADLSRLHTKIGKISIVNANRTMECISSIFRFAAICNIVPVGHNPTKGIRAFRESRRERFLSSEELARLGEAIREAETNGTPYEIDESKQSAKHAPKPEKRRIKVDPYIAAAFRLLILTGARLREILHLKWEYVDFQRGLLLLPDSKTGRKAIVLNVSALALLKKLKRVGQFVIASADPDRPRADLNRPWRTISKRSGLQGVRIHDLRHTHASVGAGAGLSLTIIGKLLGHTQASTTQRYAHLAFDPLKEASEIIGSSLSSQMGDAPIPSSSRRRARKNVAARNQRVL
jgi:integrase